MSALTLSRPLIEQFEGCRLHPYRDEAGVWTIGWGFTQWDGKPVTGSTAPITQAQADERLTTELTNVASQVACVTKGPLSDYETAALISFVYNLGIGKLATSTLLKKLNAGDRQEAADEFPKWVYAGGRVLNGLVRRRAAERAMFLGAQPEPTADDLMAAEESGASFPLKQEPTS